MIDTQAEISRNIRKFWSDRVHQRICAVNLEDRFSAAEISQSLAVFCEQHPYMSEHALSLLMARSFYATGDADAAARVLYRDRLYRAHTEMWADVLSAEYPFPELFPLFSSRVLRPLHLKTIGKGATWIFDVKKIHRTAEDYHEIILLQTLRILMEKVSNVWKKTQGAGALALKGTADLKPILCPETLQNLPGYLCDVLSRRAQMNKWPESPSVLILDL